MHFLEPLVIINKIKAMGAVKMDDNGKRILVLVGVSGSGKTTIQEELAEHNMKKLVTTTTRKPRRGEEEGKDYYFISKEDLDDYDFIERTFYNDNHYGLTRQEIEGALREYDCVHVSLDQNGAKALKEIYGDLVTVIFFDVSEEDMIARLKHRGDSFEKIKERLAHGYDSGEFKAPKQTDLIVENDNISETVDQIMCHIGIRKTKKVK